MALAGIAAAVYTGAQHSLADNSARLSVSVEGVAMEFRTLGLNPAAFNLEPGQSRTWQNLKPGTYVVVQAPPVGTYTQLGPNEWSVESDLTITCSDGSTHQHDLQAGDDISCSFTATGP